MFVKILLIICSFFTLSTNIFAQKTKPTVQTVKIAANQTVTADGSLADGMRLSNLSWAWNSSNACFPATQKEKFTGNHVFFVTELPPRLILTVTINPKKGGVNRSLYGYQIAPAKVILPDDLQSCVTCEADHKWDYPKRGKTQGDERMMTFIATTNSYKIVIGVVGANGLTEGDFTVSFSLKQ